jgi:hypothetical protein
MLAVVLSMKRNNVTIVHKIDECIASIASVLEVDREVEEIDLAWTMSVLGKFGQEHLLGVLVRYIPHH